LQESALSASRSIGPDCDDCFLADSVPIGKLHSASYLFTDGKIGSFGRPTSCQTIYCRPTAWWLELPRHVLRIGSVRLLTRRDTDPSITKVAGVWYSFGTRTIGSSINIQIAQSNDFSSWSLVQNDDGSQQDALPDLPDWVYASSPNTWAPDVQQLVGSLLLLYMTQSISDKFISQVDGSFVMYAIVVVKCLLVLTLPGIIPPRQA
jgi:hypothetical protein